MDDQPTRVYRDAPVAEREPALPPGDPDLVETRPGIRPGERPPTEPPRRSRWGSLFGWLAVLLVVAGVAAWIIFRASPQAPATGRFQSTGPMPVGTGKAAAGDMPVTLSALGTVTPLAIVTVKTQINGQLIEVAFQEGQVVKKGDFLAQIDPRPYQVALAQAEAQMAKDQATLKNAQLDLQRYRTLVAQNSIARQTLDTQTATVQQDLAVIQTDQAQIDTQKLNLTYCRIVAPVGGRVGLRQVDQGNYVQTSDANGIVVITQLQPISVIFTLPEDNLPAVLKQMHAGVALQAIAFDRTGTNKLDTGRLETVDNQIDPTTGTVKLRAIFDNAQQNLFANQFVNIQLLVDTMRGATIIPVAAVQRGAPGTFVYVVKPDSTVAATPVTLGPAQGQQVAVTKGVEPGQVLVTDGADRLKDGAKVAQGGNQPPAAAGADGTPGAASAAPATQSPAQPAAETPPNRRGQGPEQSQGQGQGRRRGAE